MSLVWLPVGARAASTLLPTDTLIQRVVSGVHLTSPHGRTYGTGVIHESVFAVTRQWVGPRMITTIPPGTAQSVIVSIEALVVRFPDGLSGETWIKSLQHSLPGTVSDLRVPGPQPADHVAYLDSASNGQLPTFPEYVYAFSEGPMVFAITETASESPQHQQQFDALVTGWLNSVPATPD